MQHRRSAPSDNWHLPHAPPSSTPHERHLSRSTFRSTSILMGGVTLIGAALWGAAPPRSTVIPISAHVASAQAATSAASSPCAATGTAPRPPATFQHVIWIFEENQSAANVIGSPQAPYFNTVAGECGLATNWHNISHDSLTNYVGALSGHWTGAALYQGKDCSIKSCPQPQTSLFGQVSAPASGGTWKDYAESMPSACSPANTSLYVPKHAPAPYFTDVAASCPTNDVSLSNSRSGGPAVTAGNLLSDLTNNSLPTFAFISPNLCDDGHNVGRACHSTNRIAATDKWLAAWLPAILNSPTYLAGGTTIFVTWDEGGGRDARKAETCWDAAHADAMAYRSCSVAMLVISPYTPAVVSTTWFNHYNLLAATEAMLGLAALPTSTATGGVPSPNDPRTAFNLG
ncbi:MAG: hypothetical protein DLM65_06095 [Candidatus Aeolococcus gillhamiae]|uniref:Phosphoesterase n=1 Tax=Candidatus Aeolococcus gillhamiae TaxID=3127015 RepID=A0A2W6ACV9_9BACT|nr:MAG: hypothetical protein DLM65_06095 [Candidatus Dormibacter sp. RRmetagenome_bin12]